MSLCGERGMGGLMKRHLTLSSETLAYNTLYEWVEISYSYGRYALIYNLSHSTLLIGTSVVCGMALAGCDCMHVVYVWISPTSPPPPTHTHKVPTSMICTHRRRGMYVCTPLPYPWWELSYSLCLCTYMTRIESVACSIRPGKYSTVYLLIGC